ncbi:ABC transporter family substrate-binding protein [Martelella sp. HB161492]|uniref:ABC transporter family substrate-binding protein n=1 Tax=Martelella sp. HB161492 TaxID=2720726 RepID=UPI00159255F3|nr:ABC transporter family substrate-binding protein [Martelella sp. HB161492]
MFSVRNSSSVLALSLALALSAAAVRAADVVAVKEGGELTIASTNSPPNWNPVSAIGDITTNRQQQWPLYPHPFVTGTDASVSVNADFLTSAKVVSQDPMVVEYVIRDDAVWSDGTPITVKDFEYTQKVQDPRACPDCKAAFTQGYDLVSSIETNDTGKLVRITFAKPFAPWKTLFPFILPAHVAESYGDLATSFNVGLSENVPKVSGGPYMVSDYQDGVAMTMVKNPKWYGSPAHLDTIRTRYITSVSEQLTALENGEINAVYGGTTLDTVEQANQMFGVNVEIGPTLTYYHFSLKANGDVMGDLALRKAITKVLDIADMTRRTVGQYVDDAEPMTSTAYIPGQKELQDNTGATGVGTGDVEGAKALLTDAGYTFVDGKLHTPDGNLLRDIDILTYSADPIRVQLAELAQSELAQIGITATIDAADRSRYTPEAKAGNFDIYATATALDLGALSLAQWYQTGAARNYFGYSSPTVDKLVDEISVTLDDAKTAELTNELDRALLSDAIVVPLFPITNMAVYSDSYANIFVNPSKYGTTMNIADWGLKAD